MFKYKENILTFFLYDKLRLNKYDSSFVSNLYVLIERNKKITTNQANLFDKLLYKYQKQLKKLGYNTSDLVLLSWRVPLEPSSVEFIGAKIILENGNIVVKVPFNKKFISSLKVETEFERFNSCVFEWDKNDKNYKAPFSTLGLKYMVQKLPLFFESVSYCERTTELLKKLELYNNQELTWNPTLVKTSNYYINAINEPLYEILKNLELSDDHKCLYTLAKMGINIDNKIVENDQRKLFAGSFIFKIDINELSKLNQYLCDFEIKKVFVTNSYRQTAVNYNNFNLPSLLNNVSIYPLEKLKTEDRDVVLIHYGEINIKQLIFTNKNVSKIVCIINSNPIKLK